MPGKGTKQREHHFSLVQALFCFRETVNPESNMQEESWLSKFS
jgi:hypothetical protein